MTRIVARSRVRAIFFALFISAAAHAQRVAPPDPTSQIPGAPIPANVKGALTIAAVGDLLGPGLPVSQLPDSGFAAVVKILKGADIVAGNNEGAIFDYRKFTGYPAAQNGGGDPVYDASVARDLKAIGFTILSKANNHAFDFGVHDRTPRRRPHEVDPDAYERVHPPTLSLPLHARISVCFRRPVRLADGTFAQRRVRLLACAEDTVDWCAGEPPDGGDDGDGGLSGVTNATSLHRTRPTDRD